MKYILLFLIINQALGQTDCQREILVQELIIRSHPNPFVKVLNSTQLGNKSHIFIDCDLYKNISEGDILVDPNITVERFRLFSKDNGVLEKKKYKVLKK